MAAAGDGAAMSIGDLIAFMATWAAGLADHLAGWMISIYQRGKAAMKRLEEIFETTLDRDGRRIRRKLEIAGAVEWDNVSFSYFGSRRHRQRQNYAAALRAAQYQRQSRPRARSSRSSAAPAPANPPWSNC